jgi:hypothetical protein
VAAGPAQIALGQAGQLIRINAKKARLCQLPIVGAPSAGKEIAMSATQAAPPGLGLVPVPRNPTLRSLSMLLPLLVGAAIALSPVPEGLPQHAWYYFAIFAAVITGLVVEPIPAAVGLVGVATAAALARFVLFDPAQLARGLQPNGRGGELGTFRLWQLDCVADLRGIHLLAWL